MLPSKVNRTIKKNGLPMCIDYLQSKCGVRLTHRDVVMSDGFFFCNHCGVKRHYVKRLTFAGRIRVFFRRRAGTEFF